jgi:hypothetical protein
MSYNIAVFDLHQKTTYEREDMIFGLLSLVNLAQNDAFQFHPLIANDKISFFFMAE